MYPSLKDCQGRSPPFQPSAAQCDLEAFHRVGKPTLMSWNVLITARTLPWWASPPLSFSRQRVAKSPFLPNGATKGDELLEQLEGHDAAFAAQMPMMSVFAASQASRLKILSRWGVGYDSINIADATHAWIPVAYTPGLLDDAVRIMPLPCC